MEWLDITKEKPNKATRILSYCDDIRFKHEGPFFIVEYYDEGIWNICNDTYPNSSNYLDFNPTYWMPLPFEPKEEQS